MRTRLLTGLVVVLLPVSRVLADVRITLQTKPAPAATQPADAEPIVTLLAVPEHAFEATFKRANQSLEVHGVLHGPADGPYRVEIRVATRDGESRSSCQTNLMVKEGEQIVLAGLKHADGSGSAMSMTVTRSEPKS
jgi:hypothetical protein